MEQNKRIELEEKVRAAAKQAGQKYWYVPFFRFAEAFGEKDLIATMQTENGASTIMQELYNDNVGYFGAAVEYFEQVLFNENKKSDPDQQVIDDISSVLEKLDHTIICMSDVLMEER